MEPVISPMANLFTDLSTVVASIWSVIVDSLAYVTQNPILLLFVVLVPVISLGISIFYRFLKIGRY